LSEPKDPTESSHTGLVYRVLHRVIDVRPEEVPVLFWCWLYIFAVLSSYYIMRPIRDEMGVAGGTENLPFLFTGTLIGMVALNLPFAYMVKTLPRSRFIPLTYGFFIVNILIFALVLHVANSDQTVWIGRVFFIWLSVYNLFVVSVFWQLNVDLFDPAQGKRLFGFISVGASLGAIVGAGVIVVFARRVAATWLGIAVFAVGRLSRLSPALHDRPSETEQPIGGSVFSGVTNALSNPYLINVSIFVLLFTITSTIVYFQQAGIAKSSFADKGAQTEFFGWIDFFVNCLTLVTQLFLTGRILGIFGVALTLALLPAFTALGFGALALAPTIMALVGFQVLRRAGDYAIARPTREVLFTVVPREDRYKAKSFIDTFVYRLGDQVGAWSYAFLATFLGLGSTTVALAAIPVALLWLANAVWLGRRQTAMAEDQATRGT
jgi:AAA family ATP:ADP antiporter